MSPRPPPDPLAQSQGTGAGGSGSFGRHLAAFHPRLFAFDAAFRHVPAFVANRLRTQALRAAGVSIGRATIFWGNPKLYGRGPIAERLKIGTYCGFNEGCVFDLEESITIEDHVAVGHDVLFLTRGSYPGTRERRAGPLRAAPIVIGAGTWLGSRSVVLPGVTIGASSVIGAGLVVAQDIPENTLWTGGPHISLARWR